ncbi:ferritin-like domain-containing protein [Salegentibacter sediminis]|uniref:ferritin-like domain-containing protein n=1 Tax=Salegentibacter sediminis TaxID=1930251 RepID=UPI0009BFE8F9|nr:PA2169 family four-helix-bundle protein [Salegentibacter sediminis]
MKYPEKIAEKLNRLLEKNIDAEKGYRFASENVKDPQLKAFFTERAEERYDFIHRLKSEIRNFGEMPKEKSSLTGDMHRTWMNLKTTLSTNKAEPALEEAVRGEKIAIEEYKEILDDPEVPASTANILLKQKNDIVAALNKVKSLRIQAD